MEERNHQGLAAILSFIVPGLGQIYNGKGFMAAVFLVFQMFFLVMFFQNTIKPDSQQLLFFGGCILLNAGLSADSAYKQAIKHNTMLNQQTEQAGD